MTCYNIPLCQFLIYLQPWCTSLPQRWEACRLLRRCSGQASPRAGPRTLGRSRSTCEAPSARSSAIELGTARSWSNPEGNPPCATFIDQPFVISYNCWLSTHGHGRSILIGTLYTFYPNTKPRPWEYDLAYFYNLTVICKVLLTCKAIQENKKFTYNLLYKSYVKLKESILKLHHVEILNVF